MSGFKIFKKYGDDCSFRKSLKTNDKNDIFRKFDKSDWSSNKNKISRGEPPKYRTFMDDIKSRDRGSPKKLRELESFNIESKREIENTEISKHNDVVFIDTKEINKNLASAEHLNYKTQNKIAEINFSDSWYNDEEIEKLKNGINLNEVKSSSNKISSSNQTTTTSEIGNIEEINWEDDNYNYDDLEIEPQFNKIKLEKNKKIQSDEEQLHNELLKNNIDPSLHDDIKKEFNKNDYKVKQIIDMIKFDKTNYKKNIRKFTKKLRQINLLVNARNSGKKLSSDQKSKIESLSLINIVLKNLSYYEDLM